MLRAELAPLFVFAFGVPFVFRFSRGSESYSAKLVLGIGGGWCMEYL